MAKHVVSLLEYNIFLN